MLGRLFLQLLHALGRGIIVRVAVGSNCLFTVGRELGLPVTFALFLLLELILLMFFIFGALVCACGRVGN